MKDSTESTQGFDPEVKKYANPTRLQMRCQVLIPTRLIEQLESLETIQDKKTTEVEGEFVCITSLLYMFLTFMLLLPALLGNMDDNVMKFLKDESESLVVNLTSCLLI